jgi:hypothetical protein
LRRAASSPPCGQIPAPDDLLPKERPDRGRIAPNYVLN